MTLDGAQRSIAFLFENKQKQLPLPRLRDRDDIVAPLPNGPTLQPGTYRVALLSDSSAPEVGFYQDGRLVGQAPVKLVAQGKKIRETEFVSNLVDSHTRMITEMDFSGWTEKIVFSGSIANGALGE